MKLPKAKKNIEMRELGGECLLYNPESRKVHLLNKTALKIWQACNGKTWITKLAEEIKQEFSPAKGVDVIQDIKDTLAELKKLSLLEEGKGGEGE